jgi:maleylacetoacetate isomerase
MGEVMKLYTYWRSSAAYRVRIALALKGLTYESVSIHLVKDGGQQHTAEYKALNPQGLVPALDTGEAVLAQSLAIMEYLDEAYPERHPLLPKQPLERAQVRAFAQTIACDVHPLNNTRVLKYLKHTFGASDEQRDTWIATWIHSGLASLEARLQTTHSPFAFGDQPGLAECCLIPQLYNARRFDVALDAFPKLLAIDERCAELPAFKAAAPGAQPDAE